MTPIKTNVEDGKISQIHWLYWTVHQRLPLLLKSSVHFEGYTDILNMHGSFCLGKTTEKSRRAKRDWIKVIQFLRKFIPIPQNALQNKNSGNNYLEGTYQRERLNFLMIEEAVKKLKEG